MLAREDEIEAYNRAQYLNNCLTPIFLTALVLEAASFFFYTNRVTIISIHKRLSPWYVFHLKTKIVNVRTKSMLPVFVNFLTLSWPFKV